MKDIEDNKALRREILLGFWKVHILHHAGHGPVVGQWMIRELREHGYEVSPGTLYPLLKRMKELGWLRCECDREENSRARRSYYLTERGRKVLAEVKTSVMELAREVQKRESRSAGIGKA